CGGAVAVVGHGLDDDGHAAGRVAFVSQLDDVVGIVGAGAASDGAIDHIARHVRGQRLVHGQTQTRVVRWDWAALGGDGQLTNDLGEKDRKSTRLNSSHVKISYAVFCLKKKKNT